jgi:hypothetical protein
LAFYVNDVVKRNDPSGKNTHERHNNQNKLVYLLKSSVVLLTIRNAVSAISQLLYPGKNFLQTQALLRNETTQEIDQRWEQVQISLASMKARCDEQGVHFIVASLPRRDQVDGRMNAEAYNMRLESTVKSNNIYFTNLYEPLQEAYEEHGIKLFIQWDGHNSKIANNVIAATLASEITKSQSQINNN